MKEDLKYLILGYRKYTETSQRELARELEVPLDIVTAMEMGSFKQPSEHLMSRVEKVTAEFDQHDLIHIGRGYRIHDKFGPDFKYFLRGLEKARGISPSELKNLSKGECYRIIGSVNLDEFEVLRAGMVA